jgi:hypothetical protein
MSLQEMCYASIVKTVAEMPPYLQEQVINTTREGIKEKVEDKLIEDIQEHFSRELPCITACMVAERLESIKSGKPRLESYQNIHPMLVKCAQRIADDVMLMIIHLIDQ